MAKNYSRNWAKRNQNFRAEPAGSRNFSQMSDENLLQYIRSEVSSHQSQRGDAPVTNFSNPELFRAQQEADRRGIQYR